MKTIEVVKCVTSGEGFVAGEIYPIVGYNNGVQICRTDEYGDAVIETYMSGGIGKGTINNWDGSEAPSFDGFAAVETKEIS